MGKYFGTDGFRGEANKDLTVEHAFKIGRYLGWFYGKDHKAKVVIGAHRIRSGCVPAARNDHTQRLLCCARGRF